MPKHSAAVKHAVEQACAHPTSAAGAKLVGAGIDEIGDLDLPGSRGLRAKLTQTEPEREKDTSDSDHVAAIVGKVGPATVNLTGRRDDETLADKVKSRGEPLTKPA